MSIAKTAIVTGASRGIGRSTALALADEGFDIVGVALNDTERMSGLRVEVEAKGRRFLGFDMNIADRSAHAHLVEVVTAKFGVVHCLVNNAGVSVMQRGDLLDVTSESYDRCFDVNTRGTFFLTQAVAKVMAADEPSSIAPGVHRSVVFVTSSNAVAASVERGEYCMSKMAAHMASRLFAIRLGRLGIGVYEVQPGLILTEMTAPSKPKYDALIEQGMTIEPRWGLPEDVARVIRTMAAGLLPYTVAQEVRVDGGLLISRF